MWTGQEATRCASVPFSFSLKAYPLSKYYTTVGPLRGMLLPRPIEAVFAPQLTKKSCKPIEAVITLSKSFLYDELGK